jgi:hypothetical protein
LKSLVEKLVNDAIAALPAGTLGDASPPDPAIERTRDPAHGDFATGVAMRLAKTARTNPRALAAKIVAALPANAHVAKTEIAGPGFINFFMTPAAWQAEMSRVLSEGARYGRGNAGAGRHTIVEFVSANPTGPLHVGHGRQAAFGATVANLLEADGWRVHREYYVNDAGRQMDILAASVWLRYLEACGETLPFPANGYRGDYVLPVAARLRERHGDAFRRPAAAVLDGLPPDEGAGGDKDQYVDALIARSRGLLGGEFRTVFEATSRATCPSSASPSTAGTPSRTSATDATADRSTAPCAGCAPTGTCSNRTGRPGSAPRSSGTRRIASSCGPTGRRPTSPPTSPTTSTSANADSSCWSPSSGPTTTATSPACARDSPRWASRRSRSKCR